MTEYRLVGEPTLQIETPAGRYVVTTLDVPSWCIGKAIEIADRQVDDILVFPEQTTAPFQVAGCKGVLGPSVLAQFCWTFDLAQMTVRVGAEPRVCSSLPDPGFNPPKMTVQVGADELCGECIGSLGSGDFNLPGAIVPVLWSMTWLHFCVDLASPHSYFHPCGFFGQEDFFQREDAPGHGRGHHWYFQDCSERFLHTDAFYMPLGDGGPLALDLYAMSPRMAAQLVRRVDDGDVRVDGLLGWTAFSGKSLLVADDAIGLLRD